MISQFRTAGAPFLEGYNTTQIYFAAQHYGMPTRLLDWSTNPMAALFFACTGNAAEDGFVYSMDAGKIIPENAEVRKGEKLYQTVMTMRNKYVESAVGLSFWDEPPEERNAYILPVRPDNAPGRIGQQSSCFTLHMHEASKASNPTMNTIQVAASSKSVILQELHRLNIQPVHHLLRFGSPLQRNHSGLGMLRSSGPTPLSFPLCSRRSIRTRDLGSQCARGLLG